MKTKNEFMCEGKYELLFLIFFYFRKNWTIHQFILYIINRAVLIGQQRYDKFFLSKNEFYFIVGQLS